MNDEIVVEIAVALADVQELITLTLDPGTTVTSALEQSGIYDRFAGAGLRSLPVGIWGRLVDHDRIVKNGDRIELYRPLQIDPREARRRLAESGRTMGRSDIG
jgi:putative ubiquitin-RnfH superfamily antitoxin RatB of RatAB toxin-antitoxin module